MKTFFGITCAIALLLAVSQAQTPAPTTTTSTGITMSGAAPAKTETVGTITEFTAGSSIALNTGSGEPVQFKFAKSVTYVNARGKEINAAKIKKDRKVRVHYTKEGNDMLVDKVTVVKE
jgi:hypothetical protein